MIVRELGAISRLREEFNSIPRDNVIKGMSVRNSYLEKLSEKERSMQEGVEQENQVNEINDDMER